MEYISGMKRHQTNIDAFMDKEGIKTDKDLADGLGMSQQQLSYRLKDKISMDTMERMAIYFKTTVKDLLK